MLKQMTASVIALWSLSACTGLGTQTQYTFLDYAWNPDNSLKVSLGSSKYFAVRPDGSALKALPAEPVSSFYGLAPDQSWGVDLSYRELSLTEAGASGTVQVPMVYRIRPDGSERQLLMDFEKKSMNNTLWSPDSRFLAISYYLTDQNGSIREEQEVVIFSPAGQPEIIRAPQLTGAKTASSILSLEWTADSQLMILTSTTEVVPSKAGRLSTRPSYELYRLKPGADKPHSVIPLQTPASLYLFGMSLSPDQSRAVLLDSQYKMHLADLSNGQLKELESGDYVTWSPDSKRLAYTTRTGDNDPQYAGYYDPRRPKADVVICDANGENRIQVTQTPELWELKPQWSPDGSYLAYLVQASAGLEHMGIYTVKPDGSGLIKATRLLNPLDPPRLPTP